jgi:uncharacterized protein YndB with AHSA1/START domain
MTMNVADERVMERVVEKVLELKAPVERVWRAISDPGELARWFPDEARFDATPGAEGAFVWREHGSFAVHVDEADPPTRLVWSWVHETGVPFAEGGVATTVVWTLAPRPDGGTTLHLRETGFPSDKRRADNDGGWDHELGELVAFLG